MLNRLRSFIGSLQDGTGTSGNRPDETKLASAVLLVEVMMADHRLDEQEQEKIIDSLASFLSISQHESTELVMQAEQEHDVLVSLYDMTRLLNSHFNQQQKVQLIEYMWQIAYADGQWDKYEEHLIRKVSDLLYVSHKDFIRAKHSAQASS